MSTQPCIPPGSLNRVPASVAGKGRNVTSVGCEVTLCDPIWYVSSRSCDRRPACKQLYISLPLPFSETAVVKITLYQNRITSVVDHKTNSYQVTSISEHRQETYTAEHNTEFTHIVVRR